MYTNQITLPEPTPEQLAHSRRLVDHIRQQIAAAGGAIDFADYMQLALYSPGLGYYSAGQQKFGEAGDFVTAPELSPLFSQCLADQCAEVMSQLPNPDLLEVGAGSGILAADLLKTLDKLNCLPSRYFIIELSADLRQRQQQTLRTHVPSLMNRVQWLQAMPEKPFCGIVVANELLDAMPVSRFRVSTTGVKQLQVGWQNRFVVTETDASDLIVDRIAPLALSDSYTSEINMQAEAWIKSIADILGQGLVLIIDYGYPQHEYYSPERVNGTLMCHYRHRAHDDPFINIGLQDITSHINFTALAEAAYDASLSVLGYTSQAAFLLATGISEKTAATDPDDVSSHIKLTNQIKRLTQPSAMGELFKVMAFGKNIDQPLAGFALQDRRGRL